MSTFALDTLNRAYQKHVFNSTRDGFYDDFAESLTDKDSVKAFMLETSAFLTKYQSGAQAALYDAMLARLDQYGGRLSAMFEDLVPMGDLLILRANDSVKAAELPNGFRHLAETIRNQRRMRRSLLRAVATFLLVSPLVLIFIWLIGSRLIPQYEKTLSHVHWNAAQQTLYWVSYVLVNHTTLLAAAVGVAGYAFYHSFAQWVGPSRVRFEKWRISLPYRIYRDYQCANLLTALAAMLRAKVPLKAALETLHSHASPWLAWHIDRILENLIENPSDTTAAFDTGILSPTLHLRLYRLARRTTFSEGLIKLGTEQMQRVNESVETNSAALHVVTLLGSVALIASVHMTNLSIGNTIQAHLKAQQTNQLRGAGVGANL